MKRCWIPFLLLLLALGIPCLCTGALASESSGFEYTILEDGSACITACSLTGEVIVPETLDGCTVVQIQGAFRNRKDISSITLPQTIQRIGDQSFYGCTQLGKIQLPDGVTHIGNQAFYGCSSMRGALRIPGSVKTIGDEAFYGCRGIQSLVLEEGIETIGEEAFSDCKGITGCITVPEGVKQIGAFAFSSCISMDYLVLPDSLETMGTYAFNSCYQLRGVRIGMGITSIPFGAFNYCQSLATLTIPEGVTTLANSSFSSCTSLKTLQLPRSAATIGSLGLSSSAVIYCYAKTPAAAWAEKNRLQTVLLDSIAQDGYTQLKLGDAFKMNLASSRMLPINVFPESRLAHVRYLSSAPEIISVDESGTLTAHALGSAVITAHVDGISGSVTVSSVIPLEDFSIIPDRTDFLAGEEIQYSIAAIPEGSDADVFWQSTDNQLLSVRLHTGQAYYSGGGSCQIVALANGIEKRLSVNVHNEIQSLAFSQDSISLRRGSEAPLSCIVTSDTGIITNQFVDFTSSAPEVARVDTQGRVTAVSEGSAVITAAYENLRASCSIRVYTSHMILPESLTCVEAEAFRGMAVEEVVLHERVMEICALAFADNPALEVIHMPDSVAQIAGDAFIGCENVVFHCASDNRAAAYARSHNIRYIIAE